MLCANRLSCSACHVALEGWASAREFAKPCRNQYFLGLSRLPGTAATHSPAQHQKWHLVQVVQPECKTIQLPQQIRVGFKKRTSVEAPRGTVTSISVRYIWEHLLSGPVLLMGIGWEIQGQDQEVSGE